jgi:hypothetical protein
MFFFHFKNCNEFNLLVHFSFIANFSSSTIPSNNWKPIQYGHYSLGNSITIHDNNGTRKVEREKVTGRGVFLEGVFIRLGVDGILYESSGSSNGDYSERVNVGFPGSFEKNHESVSKGHLCLHL